MSQLYFTETGHGIPLVLIHAFPLSGKIWEVNAKAISGKGFRVIMPDLPGFGNSASSEEVLSLESAAEQVNHLLTSLGIEKAFIGGLSMGGYVTFNFLRLYPERFLGAIFCDTTSSGEPAENIPNRYSLIDKLGKIGSQALVDVMLPNLISDQTKENNPELVNDLEEYFLRCDPTSAAAALRGFVERKDHDHMLSEINVPTLLIYGEYDKFTTVETAERIKNEIPNSTLSVIKGAGHFSNLEKPEEFNSALIEFLTREQNAQKVN
ncbi:MAG: alpha/beta hydrolase [Pyrinomonadaceae bacterium]